MIRIYNKSKNALPAYASANAAGMDLRADLDTPVVLQPLERKLIPTGLFIELPANCEAQVRPRSGLALKHGVTVLNSPGTIDADYRGEIGVLLVNLSDVPFTVNPGERIAQMVISEFRQEELLKVDNLEDLTATERGAGGFGHSGKQ